MPDPFDFDAARRALDEVPAPDLWGEAERRAADGAVVPLVIDGGRRRRPTRWLAVAAVVALAVGTVGVLTSDDGDKGLDTANRRGSGTPPATIGEPGGCEFGLSLDPAAVGPGNEVTLRTGPADPPLFGDRAQLAGQVVAHADLGTQVAEFHVPGLVVTDLVGERVEQVELQRGTADVWFGPAFVQVRWFPGLTEEDACASFTVTVAGGTEDGNRHAAVDLADRVVLAHEMDGPSLRYTEWQLERSTVDGVPTDANGSTFRFRQNDVTWTDGCNEHRATFDQSWPSVLDLLGDVASTDVLCDPNPTSEAIAGVMRADPDRNVGHTSPSRYTIRVSYDGDLLALSAGDVVLTLRPIDGGATTTTTSRDEGIVGRDIPYAIWPMTAPESILGYLPEFTGTPEEMALSFAREVLEWSDAVVTDSEPSEDGSFGSVYLVSSAATGAEVEVRVRAGEPDDLNVVYGVDTVERLRDPESSASVSSVGSTGNAGVTPVPERTATSTVRFTYGEHHFEGPMGEDIELYERATWNGADVAGAVLIVFRDASGNAIGAWGRPLPAGDFAAG